MSKEAPKSAGSLSLFGDLAPKPAPPKNDSGASRGPAKALKSQAKETAGPEGTAGPAVSIPSMGETESGESEGATPADSSIETPRNSGASGASGAGSLNSSFSIQEIKTKEGPSARPRGGPDVAPLAPMADPFGHSWPESMAVEVREAFDLALVDLLPSSRSGLPDVWIDFDLAGVALRLITARHQVAAARQDKRIAITPAEAVTVGYTLDPMPLESARRLGQGLAKAKAGGRAWKRDGAARIPEASWWPGVEGFCGAQLMRRGPTVARLMWKLGGELVGVKVESLGIMPGFGEI